MSHILLIPGLHAHGRESAWRFYTQRVANLWEGDGYTIQVHPYNWHGEEPGQEHARLLALAETLAPHHYAIGVSMGGLAVLSALRHRPHIFDRALTVASPLTMPTEALAGFNAAAKSETPENAYRNATDSLQALATDSLQKIVSLHGQQDEVVPSEWSAYPGIATHALPANGHSRIIHHALTTQRAQLQKYII